MRGRASKRQGRLGINGPFVAHSLEMRQSPAWRALTDDARRVLDVLEIEHMRHAGRQNGELIATYDQFVAAGIRRASVSGAIRVCEALGFLEVAKRGGKSAAGFRFPSRYRLTYLLHINRTEDAALRAAQPLLDATHDWRTVRDAEDAANRITLASITRHDQSQPRRRTGDRPAKDRAAA